MNRRLCQKMSSIRLFRTVVFTGSFLLATTLAMIALATTAGYTSVFGNQQSGVKNTQVATRVTFAKAGTVHSITVYTGGAKKNMVCALYADDAGEPGALLAESVSIKADIALAWVTINIPATSISAGNYWLALCFDHINLNYVYSTSGGQTRESAAHDAVANGFLANWGTSAASNTRQVSIYATYTADPTPTTYYVRTTGSDSNLGLSANAAWQTIAKAGTVASPGDTVYVGAGTYGELNSPLSGSNGLPVKYIADTSGSQTGDAGDVKIVASGGNNAISVVSAGYLEFEGFIVVGDTSAQPAIELQDGQGFVLKNCDVYDGKNGIRLTDVGITIDGCNIHDHSGNGLEIRNASTVVVRDCQVTGNTGRGITAINNAALNVTVERVVIRQNGNAGFEFNRGTALVINCLIVGNSADGIKIGTNGNTDVTVWNCTIADNASDGVEQDGGTLTLTNCIIANNSSQGLNRDGGATMTHTYNLVYGHSTDFAGTSQSTGEIVADPLLVGFGDYYLLEGSPAFNAAIDASAVLSDDLLRNARPQSGGWDLGCYEVDPPIYSDLVDGYTQNSPIAWWRLNEDAGASVALDEIAANDGLYSGGAASGASGAPIGGVNGAAQLDGTNDYISAGTLDVSGPGITVVGWFHANSFAAGETQLLSKASGSDEDSHFWSLGVNNTGSGVRMQFRLKTNGTTDTLTASSANLASGAWVFAAAVYNGSYMVLYKDGAIISVLAKTGSIDTDAATQLWLGGNPSGSTDQPFNGLLDEVAVFDEALSPRHIAAIYSGSLRGRGNGKVVIPTVWGVDKDDANLFSIDDYQNIVSGTTTYGPLKWNDGGTLTELTGQLPAMAIDNAARMFLVSGSALGSVDGPVLLRMNLEDATASGDNVVTVIGQIDTGGDIRGLTIDPLSDALYAIRGDGRMYIIDKKDGSVLSDIGQVAGLGESITAAEDLTFDAMGNLYVIDNGDDEVYRVDKTTAEILEVYANGNSGIGTMQGLAWDHLNQRLLATDTAGDDLHYSRLSGYGAATLSSLSSQALTDVEAISFMPSEGINGSKPGVRVLRWVEIK